MQEIVDRDEPPDLQRLRRFVHERVEEASGVQIAELNWSATLRQLAFDGEQLEVLLDGLDEEFGVSIFPGPQILDTSVESIVLLVWDVMLEIGPRSE